MMGWAGMQEAAKGLWGLQHVGESPIFPEPYSNDCPVAKGTQSSQCD